MLSIQLNSQNNDVINWINENSIKIEDSDPDSKLSIFDENLPKKFADAKIFGFGEATHHGKEFFDIKSKFFKYLVETQNVKTFILEDSYPIEKGINEWISGGNGDPETIALNFNIPPWYCKEVVNLLQWMRSYNSDKTEDKQIRVYGMDIQNAKGIDKELRGLISKYNIPVDKELLKVIDMSVNKKIEYGKSTDWANIQTPKLNEIKSILLNFQKETNNNKNTEYQLAIRALENLIKYTYYIQHQHSQDRDLKMFENVKSITKNNSPNGKVFIWAHNEHINNKGFAHYSTRNNYNLGRHLKEHYKNDYYSVGFDFGKGNLLGLIYDKNKKARWQTFELKEPLPKTYATTLIQAKDDIYFIDIYKALNDIPYKFFNKKTKQMLSGASGYNPNQTNLFNKKFSKMYDGLIFVKHITVPNYDLRE